MKLVKQCLNLLPSYELLKIKQRIEISYDFKISILNCKEININDIDNIDDKYNENDNENNIVESSKNTAQTLIYIINKIMEN